MYILKLKIAAVGIGLASICSVMAEEKVPEYIYNPDGSYSAKGVGQYSLNDPYGTNNSNPGSAGYVEATTAYATNHDNDRSLNSYGFRGSYGRIVGDQWAAQVDAKYEYFSLSDGYSTGDIDELSGTLHVSKKINEKFAAGLFIQGGLIGVDLWTQYSGGAEAATFLDNFTLYGRAGYSKATVEDEDADSFIGALGARIYAKDNLRFDVEGRYWEDNAEASVAALYRLPNYNTTLSLGYRYNANMATDETQSASTIFGAIRYHLGSSTLREEERNGLHWSVVR